MSALLDRTKTELQLQMQTKRPLVRLVRAVVVFALFGSGAVAWQRTNVGEVAITTMTDQRVISPGQGINGGRVPTIRVEYHYRVSGFRYSGNGTVHVVRDDYPVWYWVDKPWLSSLFNPRQVRDRYTGGAWLLAVVAAACAFVWPIREKATKESLTR